MATLSTSSQAMGLLAGRSSHRASLEELSEAASFGSSSL